MVDLAQIWAFEDALPDGLVQNTGTPTTGDDVLVGDDNPNVIRARDGRDQVWALGGDDIFDGANAADLIFAGAGNDTVTGGGNPDDIFGGSGNDDLSGQNAADRITGGKDDDIMSGDGGGGEGAGDAFVFRFAVSTTTLVFKDGDSPSGSASTTAWANYSEQLDAWISDNEALFGGVDLDVTEGLQVVGSGKNANTTFHYDNAFTGVTGLDGEGNDIIRDFNVSQGDKLEFQGITAAEFNQMIGSGLLQVTSGTDTVISWDDGSITLRGVTGVTTANLASYIDFA